MPRINLSLSRSQLLWVLYASTDCSPLDNLLQFCVVLRCIPLPSRCEFIEMHETVLLLLLLLSLAAKSIMNRRLKRRIYLCITNDHKKQFFPAVSCHIIMFSPVYLCCAEPFVFRWEFVCQRERLACEVDKVNIVIQKILNQNSFASIKRLNLKMVSRVIVVDTKSWDFFHFAFVH